MPSEPTFRQKLRYRFENTLSKGAIAIIGWLALLSLAIVLIAATVISIFGVASVSGEEVEQWGFVEAGWKSLMRTFDAGNMADDAGWPLRFVMLCVTLGGIFIVATLIGTITSGLESAIDQMRKGRSKVLESDHTLILGWSPKVFTIIAELLIANANQRNARIVILADRDKVEMEDDIKAKFPNTRNTKVICRTGSPLDLDDLEVASPHQAKSIIILSPEEASSPDTYVIKSILALTNNPNRKAGKYHIVAELRDEKNVEAAKLVGGDEAAIVLSADVIARVTAQTCRQSGLSVVYTELLDFDGAEIYFTENRDLAGKAYRQALSAYDTSTVIGIKRKAGEILINPPMLTALEAGDSVIAISEDDNTLVANRQSPPAPDESAIRLSEIPPVLKERTLLLGWNEKAASILRELDNYVGEGSEVVVVSDGPGFEEEATALKAELRRQQMSLRKAPITEKSVLESLNASSFSHIILLCHNHLEVQEADAEVLVSLLHLRNIAQESSSDFEIVSEMRDIRNRALAEVARADDFIVSDNLVSLLLTQISENKDLERVFENIFNAEGSEVYLKPISSYVATDRPLSFYTLIEAAARRGETAIGYRLKSLTSRPDKTYGVVVNPKKSDTVTFSEGDKLIVLAES